MISVNRTCFSIGSVNLNRAWNLVAPSMVAASYTSLGSAFMPAVIVRKQNGMLAQTLTVMTETRAVSFDASHCGPVIPIWER